MNREIKFRAWCGDTMIDWSAVRQTAFNCTNVASQHKAERQYSSLMYQFFTNPDWIKMQYTGLKDKNGVEIYEGDLCTCFAGDVREVVYDESFGSYMLLTDVLKVMECDRDWDDMLANSNTLEVIGNIHENPDLLGGVAN